MRRLPTRFAEDASGAAVSEYGPTAIGISRALNHAPRKARSGSISPSDLTGRQAALPKVGAGSASSFRGGSQDRCRTKRRSKVMKDLVTRFARDTSGATSIEYGLIAAGISVAIITAVTTVGNNLKVVFGNVSGNLK
jgi:pilus assembly protein Flp/PilA